MALVFASFLGFYGLACGDLRGGPSSGDAPPRDADTRAGDGASGRDEGVEPGDANDETETTDAGSDAYEYAGWVFAELVDEPEGGTEYSVGGEFERAPDLLRPLDSRCDGAVAGDCCVQLSTAPAGPLEYVSESAGEITIQRGGTQVAALSASLNDFPSYGAGGHRLRLHAGATLDVSATGADIAPFSGTLEMPSLPTGGDFSFQIGASGDISGTSILWTPQGKKGEVMYVFLTNPVPELGQPATILCTVSDSKGVVTVEESLFDGFSAYANLTLLRMLTSKVYASNAAISLIGSVSVSGALIPAHPVP